MLRFRADGAWREPQRIRVYQGGAWRLVKRAYVYASGAWRQFYTGVDALTVGFESPFNDFSSVENTTVSGSVGAVPSGGLAPFSYTWSVFTFSAGATPTLTAPSSATTTVIQTGVAPEALETATLQVVVNDSAGQTATGTVDVSFTHISFS